MDAGTYAWIVIIAFFLVFTAVRAILTRKFVGIRFTIYVFAFSLGRIR